MEIKDLIKLYINDLESKVKESPARNARINMLKDELEAINYTRCCEEFGCGNCGSKDVDKQESSCNNCNEYQDY